MIIVSDESYIDQVVREDRPVLLAFGRSGALDSRIMGPVLAEYENRVRGRVRVAGVDIDSCPQTCAEWGVGEFSPVLVLLQHGVAERVLIGVRSADRIERDVAECLAPFPDGVSDTFRMSLAGQPDALIRTTSELTAAIASLDPHRAEFLVLAHFDEDGMVQTYARNDDSFDLQWRDGSSIDDFRLAPRPVSRETIGKVFLSFLADDDQWRTLIEWGPKGRP